MRHSQTYIMLKMETCSCCSPSVSNDGSSSELPISVKPDNAVCAGTGSALRPSAVYIKDLAAQVVCISYNYKRGRKKVMVEINVC